MQVCRRTIHCRTLRLDFDGITTERKLSDELQATKLACSMSQRAVELHSHSLSSAWIAGNNTFDSNFEGFECLPQANWSQICLARVRSSTSGRGVPTKMEGFRASPGSEFRLLKSRSLGTASEAVISSVLSSTQ